jgi:hypothetical protein
MNTIAGTNEFHSVLFESSRFEPVALNILADSFPLPNAAGAGTMACPDACRFDNQPQRQGSFRPSR